MKQTERLVRTFLWIKSDLAWGYLKTAPYNLIAAIKARTFSPLIFTGFFCSSRQINSSCSLYPLMVVVFEEASYRRQRSLYQSLDSFCWVRRNIKSYTDIWFMCSAGPEEIQGLFVLFIQKYLENLRGVCVFHHGVETCHCSTGKHGKV